MSVHQTYEDSHSQGLIGCRIVSMILHSYRVCPACQKTYYCEWLHSLSPNLAVALLIQFILW
jgi:hypothetical protein